MRLERSQGQDFRCWAMKPAPASASATGRQLGKADCQAVVGQTLHGLVVVGGGLLHGHGTLGTAHLLSKPWECAKHKPNSIEGERQEFTKRLHPPLLP